MNDQPSGVGRLDKSPVGGRLDESPVGGRLDESPVVGRLKKARFHFNVQSKEKKSVEEGRAQARAEQRKGSEGIEMKKPGWNCSVEEFKEWLWKGIEMDPEMLAESRMRNLKEEEELEKIIREEEAQIRKNRENPPDLTAFFKIDWEKVIMDLGEPDWDAILREERCWGDYGLEEASSSELVLASCDKTDLDRIDSDDLPCSTEGKQISPGKHATVTERDSQG